MMCVYVCARATQALLVPGGWVIDWGSVDWGSVEQFENWTAPGSVQANEKVTLLPLLGGSGARLLQPHHRGDPIDSFPH